MRMRGYGAPKRRLAVGGLAPVPSRASFQGLLAFGLTMSVLLELEASFHLEKHDSTELEREMGMGAFGALQEDQFGNLAIWPQASEVLPLQLFRSPIDPVPRDPWGRQKE